MINFNKIWIEFECPKCGYSDEVQLIDVKTEKTDKIKLQKDNNGNKNVVLIN